MELRKHSNSKCACACTKATEIRTNTDTEEPESEEVQPQDYQTAEPRTEEHQDLVFHDPMKLTELDISQPGLLQPFVSNNKLLKSLDIKKSHLKVVLSSSSK